jgi:hypothetical protein
LTALERYIRLEATGLWRETPDAPPREVVVSFGKATLLLTDPSDAPLGHWALGGVEVTGRHGGATVYVMGTETLEIRDREMVAAIAEVTRELPAWPRAAPARRRRRLVGPIVAVAGLAAVAIAGPELLRRLAVGMVPPEQAEEIGDRVLLALMEDGGGICAEPGGQRVLDRIAARVATPPPRIRVLALGGGRAAALPGGTLVLDRAAVMAGPGAAEVAQWIAVAGAGEDPVTTLMRAAGPWANLRQVFTGDPGQAAITRAAAAIRGASAAPPAVPAPDVPALSETEALARRDICG